MPVCTYKQAYKWSSVRKNFSTARIDCVQFLAFRFFFGFFFWIGLGMLRILTCVLIFFIFRRVVLLRIEFLLY